MARRKGKRGSSLYSSVSSETISTLRLYKTDVAAAQSGLDTWGKILNAAGLYKNKENAVDSHGRKIQFIHGRECDVRLIAVSFSGEGASIEYPHDGTTYRIANANKSARVKIPDKDYIDGQWVHQTEGDYTKFDNGDTTQYSAGTAPVLRAIAPMGYDQLLFTVMNGSVDFIDIAIRY